MSLFVKDTRLRSVVQVNFFGGERAQPPAGVALPICVWRLPVALPELKLAIVDIIFLPPPPKPVPRDVKFQSTWVELRNSYHGSTAAYRSTCKIKARL